MYSIVIEAMLSCLRGCAYPTCPSIIAAYGHPLCGTHTYTHTHTAHTYTHRGSWEATKVALSHKVEEISFYYPWQRVGELARTQ